MDFRADVVPGARGLRLEGELDMESMALLEEPLAEAIRAGGPLLIDLRALRFLDTTGINACIRSAQELAAHDWCLVLHLDGGIVERVLRVAGVDRMPNVHIVQHANGGHPPAR